MKRLVLSMAAVLVLHIVRAQSVEDAKEHVYYEHYEAAKTILQNVIQQPDADPDAFYWLGEIYLEEEKTDSAQLILKAGTDYVNKKNLSKKDYPLIHIGWAHLLMEKGDSLAAHTQLTEILEETKFKNVTALVGAARATIDSDHGNMDWAEQWLDRAAKKDKKNAEVFLALGDLYRKKIDGGNAITAYNQVLAVDPSLAEAIYKQGKIYKSQNNVQVYLDHFRRAIETDSTYAPALYELYNHYFYYDSALAKKYLEAYIRHSEPSIEHQYMRADIEFISKNYQQAINYGSQLIEAEKDSVQARIYKLLAYSYESLGDSVKAFENMQHYFDRNDTAKQIAKDFELMARLTEVAAADKSKAAYWYEKALEISTDINDKMKYLGTLAELEKKNGNRAAEAQWRERIYTGKYQPSNIDIYNWGLALFASEDYHKSDSVFAIYQEKYPEQVYGYLWRAKSNALIDTTMEQGLAVPHYKKLVEVASADSVKNKSLLISAYGYLGSYEANVTKDFQASIAYFEKLLELAPGNEDATKYITTLQKWIEQKEKKTQ